MQKPEYLGFWAQQIGGSRATISQMMRSLFTSQTHAAMRLVISNLIYDNIW